MTIEIRKADPADASELTRLAFAAKRYWGYSEELIELWADDLTITPEEIQSRYMLVAELEDALVGMASLNTGDRSAEVDNLWILPEHIGNGLGTILLQKMIEEAGAQGFETVRVVSEPKATGFYNRFGASQVGWHESKPQGRRLPILQIPT